ncbi:MAG: S53 family peptidase [Ferrimicrobium sp.]
MGYRGGRLGVGLSVAALLALPAVTAQGSVANAGSHSSGSGITPELQVGPVMHTSAPSTPPADAACLTAYGISCFGPGSMAAEYNFTSAYRAGFKGQGQTIVIFDSYGSPTIRQDLATFDSAYSLPAPPAFNIYMPEGKVVLNYDSLPSPANFHSKGLSSQVGWAYETTLDVEYAHAMAPLATIDLVVVPVSETQGVQGLQNMESAQLWALANLHANIWSNSWATTEQAFNSTSSLEQLNGLYQKASASGVTAFFAAGDSGVANTNKQGVLYPYPTVNFPSSSPNVVSVGGTEIVPPSTFTPGAISSYLPQQVWNDPYGAGGGGYSSIFAQPGAQAGILDPTSMRGLPDVSYNAAVISSVLIYESFDPIYGAGWVPIGGTSAATPQWAAVDAVAQSAIGSQGFLMPKLYEIYSSPSLYAEGFRDITVGNNSFAGLAGYSAGVGWDPASGLGTPNVGGLISALKSLGS